MDLSGVLYGFYSNKEMSVVFDELKKVAESIQYVFQLDAFDEYDNMLFSKDENLLLLHYEKGYNTELAVEGCFHIEAKKTKLHGIARLLEFEGKSDFEPFDINLAFTTVYYYVLTVPHFTEQNAFSKKIYDSLSRVLAK
ncbi:hypothetical protein EGT74_06635 [Chitinophaga lutea]|uniref:Uncharacterized protein n=1 Tax=Chitinophaga lutea TaxID=2488634 RepID=A0A3N4PWV5_9BACT|nr:hypothetical protein [Chitinophaga lutea]RPE13202.1 hypothetical protein EGT74_06635 [Chitinophaga lutea]